MRHIFITLCLLALVRISGLDLAVAQLDAWAHMIQDRSVEGIELALESTFSGNSPCEKCLSIKEERKERKNTSPDTLLSLDKLKLPLPQYRLQPEPLYKVSTFSSPPPPYSLTSLCHLEVLSPPPQLG